LFVFDFRVHTYSPQHRRRGIERRLIFRGFAFRRSDSGVRGTWSIHGLQRNDDGFSRRWSLLLQILHYRVAGKMDIALQWPSTTRNDPKFPIHMASCSPHRVFTSECIGNAP
jgi:hypothetical protein